MKISTVSRHSLVDEVSEQLSEAIRRDLATDDQGFLPAERKLAEQFGVSRPVIREALKRLEFQGLVEVRQGLGVQVVDRLHAPLTAAARILLPEERERLQQSLDVRLALEPTISARAASRATKKDGRALTAIHNRLKTAQELEEAMEADLAFHHELARISGNHLFSLMLDSIADLGRESRRATMSRAGVDVAIEHHEAILNAVLAGEVEAAEASMKQHLTVAGKDLLRPVRTKAIGR